MCSLSHASLHGSSRKLLTLTCTHSGSLFNHSSSPNVTYSLDYSQYTISYRTAKSIKQGEELTIFYGHNVRFSGADDAAAEDNGLVEADAIDDGWGGLGGLDAPPPDPEAARLAQFKDLSPDELRQRDNEVIPPTDPSFHWKKVTELLDPEDAELSLSALPVCPLAYFASSLTLIVARAVPCYAIDIPARLSSPVFQFVRKHSSRKFNELGHLKRVRPLVPRAEPDEETGEHPHRADPDQLQSVLLFSVASAPPNLSDLLANSPIAKALEPGPPPKMYTVDVPAAAARTDKQASEWGSVWPVQVVHVREGAKATMRKKGWERAKLEWVERQARKVWERAEDAGRRGEVRPSLISSRHSRWSGRPTLTRPVLHTRYSTPSPVASPIRGTRASTRRSTSPSSSSRRTTRASRQATSSLTPPPTPSTPSPTSTCPALAPR